MSFINLFSIAVITLLVLGLLLGFFRGWKKSLVRIGIVLVAFLLSFFLSPVIAKAIVSKFSNGTVLSFMNVTIDFKEIIKSMGISEDIVNDIMLANGTTNDLAVALMNVVVNIILFLIIFFAVVILSLIIYWIVIAILSFRAKKIGEDKKEKDKVYYGLKFVGSGIGLFTAFLISFAMFIPIYGVMNICNKFLEIQTVEKSASAYNSSSFISGNLYYTEDKGIGKIEGYLEKYAVIKKAYDKSAAGGLMNFFGVSKLGTSAFGYLTDVNSGSLNINLTDEVVTLVTAYNIYKENFVAKKFNIQNNDSVDAVIELYETAIKSEVIENYVTELLPTLCERWTNDEAFIGVKLPITGDFKPVAKEIIGIFKTKNIKRISNNVITVFDSIKVANNNDIIKLSNEGKKIEDILAQDNDFIKDLIVELSSTSEFRTAMPNILNNTLEILYKNIIGKEVEFSDNLTAEDINSITWNDESQIIQNIVKQVVNTYKNTKDADESALIDEFGNIGEMIDYSRDSVILSSPLQIFITDYIDTLNVGDIKEILISHIDDKWNVSTTDYKFKDMFVAIGETAKVAQSISKNAGSIDITTLKDSLIEVVKEDNQAVRDTINDIITNNIIGSFITNEKDKETVDVLTDMLDTFVNNTSEDTIEQDLKAGQTIVDIVASAKTNNNQLTLQGNTIQEKQAKSEEIINQLTSSDTIMTMIDDANSTNSALNNITSGLIGEDVEILKQTIIDMPEDTELAIDNKDILKSLFGIN